MRKLLICIVLILIAALAGWLKFSQTNEKATITIETKEAVDDTKRAIEAGKKKLDLNAAGGETAPNGEQQ